jgi:superfamily I DNA/RNA helicase
MLNKKQKEVAFEIVGNAIVSASPGTGKTKTLVARAQKKLETIPKYQTLALITYTNAAADEIAARLQEENKNVFIGTIHRFCLEFILRPFSWIYNWKKPRIITYEELKEFIDNCYDIEFEENPIEELNKIKKCLDGSLNASIDWKCSKSIKFVADKYFNYLDQKNSIDFNEILYRSYKIVNENEFILKSLANKFYEILVDEFQDTNIYQYEILKKINLYNKCSFFFVGDEKQKIYKFAGAIDNAFLRASTDFNTKIECLDITYRSTNNIIRGYSSLFIDHQKLLNESEYKEYDYKIVIKETKASENNEFIEKCIKIFIEKYNVAFSEIAILTTSWQNAFDISRYLRKKYQVVGLGALPHKNVDSSTFALIRCLSKFTVSPSIRRLKIIRRNVEYHTLEKGLNFNDKEVTYAVNNLITKVENIDILIDLKEGLNAIKLIFDKIFCINHLEIIDIINSIKDDEIKFWTLEKYFNVLAGINGITINTIHQSKGLEYKAVILNGISENKLQYQRFIKKIGNNWIYGPLEKENIDNGRTLLYVGMSRAKMKLIITHNWKPSMFITTIAATN